MEVIRYCIDTCSYSQWRKGEARVAELLDEAECVYITTIVLGELYAGFGAGSRRSKNLAELDEFLASPAVFVLDVDQEVARLYADLYADHYRRGKPIPSNDLWIAACSARVNAILLTFDRHFETVTRVSTLILPSG